MIRCPQWSSSYDACLDSKRLGFDPLLKHRIVHIANHHLWNILTFIFPYICNLLLHLHHMMLVNVKIDVSGYEKITIQGYRLHWFSSFLMAQWKQSWHSCVVGSLRKSQMYCEKAGNYCILWTKSLPLYWASSKHNMLIMDFLIPYLFVFHVHHFLFCFWSVIHPDWKPKREFSLMTGCW